MRFIPGCWFVVASLVPLGSSAADPPRRLEIITPKDDAINAVALNARGDLVGFEWKEDPETPGVIGQEPFFAARGKPPVRLPRLPSYTSTFPAAVSDSGLVVGRASKPMSRRVRIKLQNQAFTWTEADGIRGLGAFPDDFASLASGVSRGGETICGITIGNDRVRACVWEREGSGTGLAWRGTPLPQEEPVASHNVAISDNGRFVAGLDGGVPVLWSRPAGAGSAWTRRALGPISSLNPRAVNNAGAVAGVILPNDGSTHAAVWTEAKGVVPIPEPAGYNRSEVGAINNLGLVVGMIDGPAGTPVIPHAFVFEDGQLRIIDEGGPNFAAATTINDAGQVSGNFEKEETPAPVVGPTRPTPSPAPAPTP